MSEQNMKKFLSVFMIPRLNSMLINLLNLFNHLLCFVNIQARWKYKNLWNAATLIPTKNSTLTEASEDLANSRYRQFLCLEQIVSHRGCCNGKDVFAKVRQGG